MRLSSKEKTTRKRGKSLTLTVRVSESTNEDGGVDAVQPKPELSEQMVKEDFYSWWGNCGYRYSDC